MEVNFDYYEKLYIICNTKHDRFIIAGILLPHLTMSIKKVETAAKFVLLVEKHTIYEKLLIENILSRLGPCLLVTVRINVVIGSKLLSQTFTYF